MIFSNITRCLEQLSVHSTRPDEAQLNDENAYKPFQFVFEFPNELFVQNIIFRFPRVVSVRKQDKRIKLYETGYWISTGNVLHTSLQRLPSL